MGRLQAAQVTAPAGTVHGESGSVTLRIFVDRTILEVYCGGAALTDRLYPDASATGVDLYAEGGVAHVKTVSVWPLRGTLVITASSSRNCRGAVPRANSGTLRSRSVLEGPSRGR